MFTYIEAVDRVESIVSTMGNRKFCSIIIVTFNSSSYIGGCLAPLIGILEDVEIIVVDNNSVDNTLGIIKRDFPSIKTLSYKENVGFGRASNRGVAESEGEHVFLLNPDTVPSASAINTVCDFLKNHPRVGIAGARQIDSIGQHFESTGDSPSLWRMLRDVPLALMAKHVGSKGLWGTTLGAISTKYKTMTRPEPVSWVSGAALCCRRSTWEHLGGLDENFFLYYEDIDLCLRAAQAGWEVWYVPNACVTHYSGASFAGDHLHQIEVYYASQRYFFRKHHGLLSAFLLGLAQGLSARLGLYRQGTRDRVARPL